MVLSPMDEATAGCLVYDVKLSSVGPGNVTPPDTVFKPRGMDLAMKLHYLRGVYYFATPAFEGLTTLMIKQPIFYWLNQFPVACGRFRRDESGRAYMKCNDCGVRFVEGKCDKTLHEWLEMEDVAALEKLLVPDQCIGPELQFSPPIYIQFTKFKCGGMAVGLSWAHVLGDAFSAAEFMNSLGRIVGGSKPERPINLSDTLTELADSGGLPKVLEDPLSIRRVGPVGDHWKYVADCKMEAFSFDVTPTQLSHLQSKLSASTGTDFSTFDALRAVVWQCIARIRGEGAESGVVTTIFRKKGEQNSSVRGSCFSNGQVVSVVKADFPVVEASPGKLAALVEHGACDERKNIEQAMESDDGLPDFIVYGANLTFVNLEEAKFYDFEYRGHKAMRVSYRIDGVGDKGVVLVLPGPKDGSGNNKAERTVMAILPENEVVELKSELKREGLIMA